MTLCVIKFGGTSLGSIDKIRDAAKIVKSRIDNAEQIIVVTSAMSGHTNKIVSSCRDISTLDNADKRYDYDTALSTGETFAASIFALALKELGINSRMMQSWQIPIKSTDKPNNALIKNVDQDMILNSLNEDIVPVITGFQALNSENRITTIGRGGSDTTAAAIAAAVTADFCDIYTDVEGVYSIDPRFSASSKIINSLSYEESLELAGSGAKVIHPRSIEICRKFDIKIRIFSTFTGINGTVIMKELESSRKISGVNILRNFKIYQIDLAEFELDNFLILLEKDNINIHQILSYETGILRIAVSSEFSYILENLINKNNINCKIQDKISCVTLVGSSIRHDISILSDVVKIISNSGSKLFAAVNSEIKIACYVEQDHADKIIKEIHKTLIENE